MVKSHDSPSIPELNLYSLAFLPDDSGDRVLAVLSVDYTHTVRLVARELVLPSDDSASPEIDVLPSSLLAATPLSTTTFPFADFTPSLIPIPASETTPGGVLIINGHRLMFFEVTSLQKREAERRHQKKAEKAKKGSAAQKTADEPTRSKTKVKSRKPTAVVDWPWSTITAWGAIDDTRFLLGDAFGRISLLALCHPQSEIKARDTEERQPLKLVIHALGISSSPTTLTHLNDGTFFLGSHFGDSIVVKIHSKAHHDQNLPSLPVPDNVTSISPSAFTVAKQNGQLQSCIVVGEGSFLDEIQRFKNIGPVLDATFFQAENVGAQVSCYISNPAVFTSNDISCSLK